MHIIWVEQTKLTLRSARPRTPENENVFFVACLNKYLYRVHYQDALKHRERDSARARHTRARTDFSLRQDLWLSLIYNTGGSGEGVKSTYETAEKVTNSIQMKCYPKSFI